MSVLWWIVLYHLNNICVLFNTSVHIRNCTVYDLINHNSICSFSILDFCKKFHENSDDNFSNSQPNALMCYWILFYFVYSFLQCWMLSTNIVPQCMHLCSYIFYFIFLQTSFTIQKIKEIATEVCLLTYLLYHSFSSWTILLTLLENLKKKKSNKLCKKYLMLYV